MNDDILNKNQTAFLKKCGQNKFIRKNFYLTGGTVLAAFYLRHRYSEDLDFFSENEFNVLSLDVFLNQSRKELGIIKIDYQQSFNRNLFFLHFKGEILKIEFTFFPFARIDVGTPKYHLEVDSILDIAVNKLFSIYQRTQARDYIDLYCLHEKMKFSMVDLIKKVKIKFDWHIDPLQLGAQFMKAREAKDYPRMIKKIDDKEWQNFFIKEASKLKKEILR